MIRGIFIHFLSCDFVATEIIDTSLLTAHKVVLGMAEDMISKQI